MKHASTKLFIMFLAGILFSAITVFAATISVNTNFASNAVQYLQQLVLTDASGNTTGVVLDGINKKIQSDTICSTDGDNCKTTANLLTNYSETDPVFTSHSGEFLRDELWNTGASNSISYTAGNVGINTENPSEALEVSGDIRLDGNVDIKNRLKIDPTGSYNYATGLSIEYGNSGDEYEYKGLISATKSSYGADIILTNRYKPANVGIGTFSPTAKLDVNGSIRIGNDGSTCTSANSGTLRYREEAGGDVSHLEICATKGGVYDFRTVQTFSP